MGIKQEQYFWLKDGSQVKNLYDLSKALEKMPKKIFSHHVTKEKNDFSNWVRDVVGNKELAEKMASVKTAETMSKYINKALKPKKENTHHKRIVDTSGEKAINQVIGKKMQEKKSQKWHESILPKKTGKKETLKGLGGAKCPYRSLKCGWQEILLGVIVGLTAAIILSILL